MRVERSYLVRVVQVYEGDPPPEGWSDRFDDDDEPLMVGESLYGGDDQYVCDNWKLISDEIEAIDDDQLETTVEEL